MWPGVRIQICISSINERGIEEHMLKMPALKIETLNHQTMRHDVDLLVRASIADHHRLRQHSPQLKEEIVWTLTRGAQGMYDTFFFQFIFYVYSAACSHTPWFFY